MRDIYSDAPIINEFINNWEPISERSLLAIDVLERIVRSTKTSQSRHADLSKSLNLDLEARRHVRYSNRINRIDGHLRNARLLFARGGQAQWTRRFRSIRVPRRVRETASLSMNRAVSSLPWKPRLSRYRAPIENGKETGGPSDGDRRSRITLLSLSILMQFKTWRDYPCVRHVFTI